MGLILDSSVLIAAERQGQNARQMIAAFARTQADIDIALSVITLVELAHGAARADNAERQSNRQRFILDLLSAVPVHTITPSIALHAGRIDGENRAKGIRLALSDLLIGVTALELGYGVATRNVRHFRLIPGLAVVQL